jgi:hypothetical protein
MPQDPPPSPPNRLSWAYALAAAAIWAMAAYDLIAPKPPPPVWRLAAAGQACPH